MVRRREVRVEAGCGADEPPRGKGSHLEPVLIQNLWRTADTTMDDASSPQGWGRQSRGKSLVYPRASGMRHLLNNFVTDCVDFHTLRYIAIVVDFPQLPRRPRVLCHYSHFGV